MEACARQKRLPSYVNQCLMYTAPLRKKFKILLVDDTPDNLVSLEAALSPLEQDLIFAHSGKEALRCLLHQDFAAILLDVKMPGMDGFETAEVIRTGIRSRRTPILFMTAYRSDEHIFRGYDLGAVDFLFKPIIPEVLRSKVAAFVELARQADELSERAILIQEQSEVLRKAEHRFRSLLEAAPDAMVICEADATIQLVNSKTERLSGYSRHELVGKSVRTILPGWGYELVSSADSDLGEVVAETAADGGLAVLHREGTTFPVETSLSPLKTDDGLLIITAIRDISARVRVEQDRKKAEEQVRQLNIHLAELNATLEQRVIERTEQLMASNEEVRRINQELELRVAQRTLELQKSNEQLNRSNQDLRRVEEQLRYSEHQLIEAQHLACVGSWNWDIRNGVLIWSDEVYRIFGLEPRQFDPTPQAFSQLAHPEDRDFITDIIDNSIRTRESISCYFRIVQPCGSCRTLYFRANTSAGPHGNTARMFGTLQDVTERRMAEQQLTTLNQRLRALSANLESAREEEGTRIAREIHDELGASLTSLKWDLENLDKMVLEAGSELQFPALREKIAGMIKVTDSTVNTVRRIASELRPSILDDLGLLEALEWQAQRFQARTGIMCDYTCLLEVAHLARDQSTGVFRIGQEALTNILRHAEATKVEILVEQVPGEFVLAIKDNGRGITEEEKCSHVSLGILGMQERAHLIGAQVDIIGTRGKGTLVTVRVPLSAAHGQESTIQLHA